MIAEPLIVVDLGGTFGNVVGEGANPAEILAALVPDGYHRRLIGDWIRETLCVNAKLDAEIVKAMCHKLLCDVAEWPDPWPSVSFALYEHAREVLAELNDIGPVVTLTNQSVTAKPAMDHFMTECGGNVAAMFASYDMGDIKPATWLWHDIADSMHTKARNIIHVGDLITEDGLAPLAAGAHGAVLVHAAGTVPPRPNLVSVQGLRDVPAAVARLAESMAA